MRDRNIFGFKRALPRMSWHPYNLWNLWQRTVGLKAQDITFKQTHFDLKLFAQRFRSKAAVRAYHGDYIPEKVFQRWYLPDTLPDVRINRVIQRKKASKAELLEYAGRKQKEHDYYEEQKEKGLAPVGSLMFSETERRLDTLVFRSCFTHSIYDARRLVIHGRVRLNGVTHTNCGTRLAPGDMISVDPEAVRWFKDFKNEPRDDVNAILAPDKKQSLTPFFLPHFASPWLFIPAYIEANFATCSAIYVRHPTARPGYSEIPTPYDADGEVVRLAWEWYAKRRPRIRSKRQFSRMPLDRTFDKQSVEIAIGRERMQRIVAQRKKIAKGILV